MSCYYDPVTHRFINADGYFQSGGNILDTNMSAYCGNNPVNCYDPYGEMVYTLAQLQENLAMYGHGNYTINDITRKQLEGYSMDDRFFLSLSGELIHYNVGYQIADTFMAVVTSIEFDTQLGFGAGATVNLEEFVAIDFSAGYAPVALHYDYPNSMMFGQSVYEEGSLQLCGWDLIGFPNSHFYDYATGKDIYDGPEKHVVGVSFGGYFIVGGEVGFGWNLDYIGNTIDSIWGL